MTTQGPRIEHHPRFPKRVNAGYMQAVDRAVRRAGLSTLGAGMGVLSRALGDRGRLARAYGTGTMVLWVSILLAFYLILYYA